MRNNMPEAPPRLDNDPCVEVVDYQTEVGKLRKFCHFAYRLFIAVPFDFWGMRLTQSSVMLTSRSRPVADLGSESSVRRLVPSSRCHAGGRVPSSKPRE